MTNPDTTKLTVGIVGGSGLYELDGLTHLRRVRVETPYGAPSDDYVIGQLGAVRLVFLPRHGRGHRLCPHEINYRANIAGFKQLGCRAVLSVSAVGSMREEIRPGDLVIVDQFIDRTSGRERSFFGQGVVGHVQLADPICPVLAEVLYRSSVEAGARVHRGGTYVVIDGPQFSTRAESKLYRSWGVDVIGMTNLPEARLAREAQLCYSTLALSTDYDCWREGHDDVTVAAVLEVMAANVALARKVIAHAVGRVPAGRSCGCGSASQHAVVTQRDLLSDDSRQRLELILGAT
jgi:5'-methylthioadenosine phosphorylase